MEHFYAKLFIEKLWRGLDPEFHQDGGRVVDGGWGGGEGGMGVGGGWGGESIPSAG